MKHIQIHEMGTWHVIYIDNITFVKQLGITVSEIHFIGGSILRVEATPFKDLVQMIYDESN